MYCIYVCVLNIVLNNRAKSGQQSCMHMLSKWEGRIDARNPTKKFSQTCVFECNW